MYCYRFYLFFFYFSDAKFSLKTRLLGAVKTFHYFLKVYHNHAKLLVPILLIIKALSRNSKYLNPFFDIWAFPIRKPLEKTVKMTNNNNNNNYYFFLIANTAAVLARDGIVGSMEKVLGNIGFTPSAKLRLALNVITYLSKNSKDF